MGALSIYLTPKLAADASIDLPAALKGVTAKNWKAQRPKLTDRIKAATTGKLAQDADLEDLPEMLETLDDVVEEVKDVVAEEVAPPKPAEDDDAEMIGRLREVLAAKGMSDEDIDAVIAAMNPEVTPAAAQDKTPGVTPAAMDAALRAAGDAADRRAAERFKAVREAERAVRPYVGELAVAQDSAEGVYRDAFKVLKVDVEGVHPSAFPTILKMQPIPGEARPTASPTRVAMDGAATAEYRERFPNAARLKR